MKYSTVVVALAVSLVRSLTAQVEPTDENLRRIAIRIADLDVRRQAAGGTMATIDSLLALYSDSVVYEHPSVGARVSGKAAMREGMARYLGSRPGLEIAPQTVVVGVGVVVLESAAGPDPRNPSRPIPSTRRAIRVLEFDGRSLVRRIIDFPW